MTPVQWLQFLAVLLSSLSITTETSEDLNSTINPQITHGLHYNMNNVTNIKGIQDLRTTSKENKLIPNNIEYYYSMHNNYSKLGKKFNFKFVDFIEQEPNRESGLSKIKSYIGQISWWKYRKEENIERIRRSTGPRNRTAREMSELCSDFHLTKSNELHSPGYPENYKGNVECTTIITAPGDDQEWIIIMDFRDFFNLEYHSNCSYDFLEIRDGSHGYDDPVSIHCGHDFPPQFRSQGPNLWIRFKSDSIVEYRGFKAVFSFEKFTNSRKSIIDCSQNLEKSIGGEVTLSDDTYEKCKANSKYRVDAIWTINVHESYNIFLNFTNFKLAFPNECKKNFVEVFGMKTDMNGRLKQYCGTIAESLVHLDNVLHVRLVSVIEAVDRMNFSFHYTAFRKSTRDTPCKVATKEEWDCDDMTCIDYTLKCDGIADCRFKGDEDEEECQGVTESPLRKTNTIIILVIFSILFTGMCLVMIYRCIRKLVADNKIIKEHIREACEQRLDMIVGGDSKPIDTLRFQSDFLNQERASVQRENFRNENNKKQRKKDLASNVESKDLFESRDELEKHLWSLDHDDIAKFNKKHMEGRSNQPTSKDKKATKIKSKAQDTQVKHEKDIKSKKDEDKKNDIGKKGNEDKKEKNVKRETKDLMNTTDYKETGEKKKSHQFPRDGTLDENETRDKNVTDWDTTGQRGRKEASRRKETDEKIRQDTGTSDVENSCRRKVSICLPGTKETDCKTKESLLQGSHLGSSNGLFQKDTKKMSGRRPVSAETTRSAPDVIVFSDPDL